MNVAPRILIAANLIVKPLDRDCPLAKIGWLLR